MSFNGGRFPDPTNPNNTIYTDAVAVKRINDVLSQTQAENKERNADEQADKDLKTAQAESLLETKQPAESKNPQRELVPTSAPTPEPTFQTHPTPGYPFWWQDTGDYFVGVGNTLRRDEDGKPVLGKRDCIHVFNKKTKQKTEMFVSPALSEHIVVMSNNRVAILGNELASYGLGELYKATIFNIATGQKRSLGETIALGGSAESRPQLQYWTNGREECLAAAVRNSHDDMCTLIFSDPTKSKLYNWQAENLLAESAFFYLVDKTHFAAITDRNEMQLHQVIHDEKSNGITAIQFSHTLTKVSPQFTRCNFHHDLAGNIALVVVHEREGRYNENEDKYNRKERIHLLQPSDEKQFKLHRVVLFDKLTENWTCTHPVYANRLNSLFFYVRETRQIMRLDCKTYEHDSILQLQEHEYLKELFLAPDGTLTIMDSSNKVTVINNEVTQYQQWLNEHSIKFLVTAFGVQLPSPLLRIVSSYMVNSVTPMPRYSFDIPPYLPSALERQLVTYKQELHRKQLTCYLDRSKKSCAEEIADLQHLSTALTDCTSFAAACTEAQRTRPNMFDKLRFFRISHMPKLREALLRSDTDFMQVKAARLHQHAVRLFKLEDAASAPAADEKQKPQTCKTVAVKKEN